MRLLRFLVLRMIPVAAVLLGGTQARAQGVPPFPSVRALGMGGALRGAATGDSGLALNPSGMSLMRAYVLEGAYGYRSKLDEHDAHIAVIDSTSGFNVAGGVYYTYLAASPTGGRERSGHEGGLALAVPFGDKLFLGGLVKYVRLTDTGGDLMPDQELVTKGFTMDAGLTIRPVPSISLGAAAYNLRNMEDPRFPFALGWGLAISPSEELTVAVDAALDFTRYDPTRGNELSFMGGGEYLIAKRVAVRAGGGRRGAGGVGYVSGGLAFVAETGAIDAGVQQDVSGEAKQTFFIIGARLFVPSP